MDPVSVVYCAPELEPFLSLGDDPLVFEKELIYEGQFTKKDANGEVNFGVDGNTLVHWKNTVDTMLSNDIAIPMPLDHTTNPEQKRADLIGARIGRNQKGKLALYGKTRFPDAESAKLAGSSDVSIFVAPEFTDGLGRKYTQPIRHVAFTNYPVIPGLEKFQAIAASFSGELPDGGLELAASPLLPVAQQIGIQASDTMDDAQLTQAIVAAFNALKQQCAGGQQPGARPMPGAPQPGAPMPGAQPGMAPPMRPAMGAHSHSPALVRLLKENREVKLDSLVSLGHLSKASRDILAKEFCSPEGLALSLTADDGTDRTFDAVVNAAKLTKVVNYDERTGHQLPGVLALSNPARDRDDNPLLKNAEARAKEMAESN